MYARNAHNPEETPETIMSEVSVESGDTHILYLLSMYVKIILVMERGIYREFSGNAKRVEG